jgi:hypothetical protein
VEVDSGAVEVDLMVAEVGVDLVDLLEGEDSKVVEVMPVMEIEGLVVDEVDSEDHQEEVTLEVEEGVDTEEVEDSSKYKSKLVEYTDKSSGGAPGGFGGGGGAPGGFQSGPGGFGGAGGGGGGYKRDFDGPPGGGGGGGFGGGEDRDNKRMRY